VKETIIADPRRALEKAVPVRMRQQLPPEIVAQLEERVSTRAFFGVLAVPPIRREVRTEERKFDGRVYGRRARQQTTENALITGVAVDRVLAVDRDAPGHRHCRRRPMLDAPACPALRGRFLA
jgi:hypothetical protein